MLKTLLSKRHHGRPAQALVEFTLTALVFLFLIVMIIEVARIMQAYVTLQHAAREGARTAVTGQFDPKYGTDPLAGWQVDRATADPLESIRPCWPLFWDDPHAPTLIYGAAEPRLYQPYRDARTCTVEEATVRSMAGLIMNPNVEPTEPDYYNIIVSGTATDIEPETGTFQRGTGTPPNMETLEYLHYYHDIANDPPGTYTPGPYLGINTKASRGYAGDPGKKVQVQIEYRVRMITPLLSNIVRSVRLTSIATMTVENFGSMSLQRKAVSAPPDVEPEPFESQLSPPDLYVSIFICPTTMPLGGPIKPLDTIFCDVEVRNQGDTPAGNIGKLWVYSTTTQVPLDFPFNPGPSLSSYDIGALVGGSANGWTKSIPITFPVDGDYYIYVWADATGAFDDPDHDGAIKEIFPGYDDHENVTNNLEEAGPIPVRPIADLEVQKTVNNETPPQGSLITYTVTVINHGPSDATGVVVTDKLPAGVACDPLPAVCSDDPANYDPATGAWTVGNLGAGISRILHITPRVGSVPPGIAIPNNAGVTHSDVFEPSPDVFPSAATIDIIPGSIDMTVAKAVTSPSPAVVDFGTSPTVTFMVRATNNSTTTDATNVVVVDTLPPEFLDTGVTATTTIGACTVAGRAVSCNVGPLSRGASVDVTITAVVSPSVVAGTVISNQATVTAAELTGSKVSDPPTTVTVRGADIEVVKTASVTSANEGQQFTYTVTAHNRGPSDAQNIRISDVLPATLQYVSQSPDAGTTYDQGTGLWNVGSLSNLTSKSLTITVSPKAGTLGSTIVNTATLQAGSTPPQPTGGGQPDSASASVQVIGGNADLALTKTVSPTGTVNPGTTLTYTLTLLNNGPSSVTTRAVQDATLANAITSGLLLPVSATVSTGTYASGQWTGISLSSGQSATAVITVRAVGTANTNVVFANTASIVAGTPPDPNTANNTATATIQINWPAPIFINAGNASGGCVQSNWGLEDPTLLRDYTWRVTPANWERLGGGQNWNLLNRTYSSGEEGSRFIKNQESPVVELATGGRNLFGCRSATSSAVNNTFRYRFYNLLPGTWRIVLAFAPTKEDYVGSRLLEVTTSNDDTTWSVLPGMNSFDIVGAIQTAGFNPFKHFVNPLGPDNEYWNIHYIIKRFDNITVTSNNQLYVRFKKVGGGSNYVAHVNGVGIEFVAP